MAGKSVTCLLVAALASKPQCKPLLPVFL
jgi:hypothetical protein